MTDDDGLPNLPSYEGVTKFVPGVAYISGDSKDGFGWCVFVYFPFDGSETIATVDTEAEAVKIRDEYNTQPVREGGD